MQSKATTVAQYLANLPSDRRQVIEAVRKLILRNLDQDYEEGMQYGMIGYFVPHRVYPAGYHCDPKQPLPYLGLASQKNYMSLYLMCVYADPKQQQWFEQAWAKAGKKLNMGKSCVRFKSLDDLALEVVAETIKRTPARRFIAQYEACLKGMKTARVSAKSTPKRKSVKRVARSSAAARPKRPPNDLTTAP